MQSLTRGLCLKLKPSSRMFMFTLEKPQTSWIPHLLYAIKSRQRAKDPRLSQEGKSTGPPHQVTQAHCANLGGHLASVHNADANTFITSLIKSQDTSDPVTWLGTSDCQQAHCANLGGHLSSGHNANANKLLINLIKSQDSSDPATGLGASNSQPVSVWLWTDGSKWDYTNWNKGEPSNGNNVERCLHINYADPNTPLRLVNGGNRCSGNMEVFHQGQWGSVCDDGWDLNDAKVVCRQLGCGRAISAPGSAHFGGGSGKIWMDDVACTGKESSLMLCQHSGLGEHNCCSHEDAGVVCSSRFDMSASST
ncbi:DMBT1 protein, partial [Polypterus senegalus]